MVDYFKAAGASCSRSDARRPQLGAIGPYQPSGGVHAAGTIGFSSKRSSSSGRNWREYVRSTDYSMSGMARGMSIATGIRYGWSITVSRRIDLVVW